MDKRTERKKAKKKIRYKDTKSDWVKEKSERKGNYWASVRVSVTGYKSTAKTKGGRSCRQPEFLGLDKGAGIESLTFITWAQVGSGLVNYI